MNQGDSYNYESMVADLFIELRGGGLVLSSLDLQAITAWRKQGVPLHLVLNAIEEIMGNHKGRRVRSITYCAEEIEARFAELLELHVGCGGCDAPYCLGKAA